MSFRNRPTLGRKHRPRWQDELRTQQLVVAGFAGAIAVALGIFAAATWSSFYNANLRQIAVVDGRSVERAELEQRTNIIASELLATAQDLQAQRGGARDSVIDQQLQAINQRFGQLDALASDSLLTGILLEGRADELGISVSDRKVDREVTQRRGLPERKQLSLILISAEPEASPSPSPGESAAPAESPAASQSPTPAPSASPGDADFARAEEEARSVLEEIDAGADFAELATEHSDDASSESGGLLGWITARDAAYSEFFEAAAGAEAGDVVGPKRNDQGWYLLRVDDLQARGPSADLDDLLTNVGVGDDEYREYVRQDLLRDEFKAYFGDSVVGRYGPQRRIAQIVVSPPAEGETTTPTPEVRIRHILVSPLPGETDQSAATDAQWDAALERALDIREELIKPDADWFALAKQSDDTQSASRGGDLGWTDLSAAQFVPEFTDAVRGLREGEISEPVRSEFGYHLIEVVERRAGIVQFVARLSSRLQDDPDRFARLAADLSDDLATAGKGGELGWVAPYQLDHALQQVVFSMNEPGQISEPVETDSGTYIFKLLEASDGRYVTDQQRQEITQDGFPRWLDQLREDAGLWIDPQIAQPATAGG